MKDKESFTWLYCIDQKKHHFKEAGNKQSTKVPHSNSLLNDANHLHTHIKVTHFSYISVFLYVVFIDVIYEYSPKRSSTC